VKLPTVQTAAEVAAATAKAVASGTGVQSKFFCQICKVSATNQLQLDTHLNGTKHKLQAQRRGMPASQPAACGAEATAAVSNSSSNGATGVTTEPPAKRAHTDYSIYRTPSGKYYCLACNLTLNSESQFAQHWESKKHKIEVYRKKNTMSEAYGSTF